jgi:DNA-binding PadR family transcriptional regulator
VDSKFRPSPLALAVLSLLVVGPLHPYAIQRLIKLWGKDQVVNVGQRANLYKTIKRLHDAGLIAVWQTERDQQFPERTVYELTEQGRRELLEWLADMLATPRNEFPQFPAALSFVMLLEPEEALAVLERRAAVLRENLTRLEGDGAGYSGVPRVALLDDEYQRALTAAELSWVSGVIDDLRTGELTWSEEELAEVAKSTLPELRRPWRGRAGHQRPSDAVPAAQQGP